MRKRHIWQGAGRGVRLSGNYVWQAIVADDGTGVVCAVAVEEEYQAHGREDPSLTRLNMTWQETTKLVDKLNRMLRGWATYFNAGSVSRANRALDMYMATRLRPWLCNKYKVRRRRGGSYSLSLLLGHFGLVRLTARRGVVWRV
jgi:hypothetical protein